MAENLGDPLRRLWARVPLASTAMTFALDEVVPWGRGFDEYRTFFQLPEQGEGLQVLGCGDGPASFQAESREHGFAVVSSDPLYRFGPSAISRRIQNAAPVITEQMRANRADYVWRTFCDIDQLIATRLRAMHAFLEDFASRRKPAKYIAAALPELPFADHRFQIALCSHFLFLYSRTHDFDFHLRSILELLRVAPEVRIFPVLEVSGSTSPWLAPACAALAKRGVSSELVEVDYEVQRGGNRMLRLRGRVSPRSV